MTRTRMRCCALMGVVVAFLSAAAFAAVGDLEYASNPPPGRGLNVGFRDPEKVSDGGKMGLDSANAVVATGVASGIKISAALTRSKAGAEDFDVLRLDTTGKQNFRGAAALPVRTTRKDAKVYLATVGPGQVTVKKDGKAVPMTVVGRYYETNGRRRLYLTFTAAAEGTCAFGKAARKIRIVDVTGNFSFADALKTAPRGFTRSADMVHVADQKGRFLVAGPWAGTPIGHPVQVADKWYMLTVDGMKASAAPLKCPMGKVAGNGDPWQVVLMGKKYMVTVTGGAQPVSVPADSYRLMLCSYFRPGEAGKAVPAVSSYPRKSVEVAAGNTLTLEMGLPMQATMSARVAGGKVAFSVKRVDAAGHRIVSVLKADGEAPPAPSIDVVDKTGKVVYTAKLEYG